MPSRPGRCRSGIGRSPSVVIACACSALPDDRWAAVQFAHPAIHESTEEIGEKSLIHEIRAEPEENSRDEESDRSSRCPEARIPPATNAMSPRRPSGPGSCLRIAVTLSAVVLGTSCRPAHRPDSPDGRSRAVDRPRTPVPCPFPSRLKVAEPARDRPERSPIRFRDVTEATGITSSIAAATAREDSTRPPMVAASPCWTTTATAGSTSTSPPPATCPSIRPDASGGNRLYRNRGDGTFEDVTDRAGVGYRGFCHGLTVGDMDSDGYPDLFLANLGPNVLYLNNGDGTFREADGRTPAGRPALVLGGGLPRLRRRRPARPLCLLLRRNGPSRARTRSAAIPRPGIRTYCSPRR